MNNIYKRFAIVIALSIAFPAVSFACDFCAPSNTTGTAPSMNTFYPTNVVGTAPSMNNFVSTYGGGSAPSMNTFDSTYGGGSAPSMNTFDSTYGGGSAPTMNTFRSNGNSGQMTYSQTASVAGSLPALPRTGGGGKALVSKVKTPSLFEKLKSMIGM